MFSSSNDYCIHNFALFLETVSGINIVSQKLFRLHGEEPLSLNWDKFGFLMDFEEGTILPSQSCEICIQAIVGGEFELPEKTQLVSGIYAISFTQQPRKPVKMRIQHCVLLKNETQANHLSFVLAPITKSLPHKFKLVKGGKFCLENQYGSIIRSEFCLAAIIKHSSDTSDDNSSHTSSSDEEEDSEVENHSTEGKYDLLIQYSIIVYNNYYYEVNYFNLFSRSSNY